MKTLKNAFKILVVIIFLVMSVEGWGKCDLRDTKYDFRCTMYEVLLELQVTRYKTHG